MKSSEVIEVYKEFCEEVGRPKYRKKDTGCMSCLVAMIKEMTSYVDREKRERIEKMNKARENKKDKKEKKPPYLYKLDENEDENVAQQEEDEKENETYGDGSPSIEKDEGEILNK